MSRIIPDASNGNHVSSRHHAHPGPADACPEIGALFWLAVQREATALHLKAGRPPAVRVKGGGFQPLEYPPLSRHDVERLALSLLTPGQSAALAEEGSVTVSHVAAFGGEGGACRFQVSLFRQRGELSLVARRLGVLIPKLEALGLPDAVARLCELPSGLIVVAGPAGSGRRTTVASMLERINERRPLHLLTLEDALAFDLADKAARISQREHGSDFRDRQRALEDAVAGQDVDVLSVGELRDARAFDVALRAAERDRLVFATVAATDTASAVGNLLELIGPEKRGAARKALAACLKAVLVQRLLKGLKKPRVLAHEIMTVNPTIRKLISEGMDSKIADAIKLFYQEGMVDFTESLRQLVERGDVDKQMALEFAPDPEKLKMAFKGIKVAMAGLLGDAAPAPPAPARAPAGPPPSAPVRAPAPAARPAPAATKREEAPSPATRTVVRRRATVRYFTRMYPDRLYRLLVVLSGEEVRKLLLDEVGQASSVGFTVRVNEPIEVEPILPGCSVYPPRLEVTLNNGDRRPVEARFQVLAHVQSGTLEGPAVVLRQEGRELARVALKVRVGKPTVAYGLSAASVVVPSVLKYLKLDPDTQAAADFGGYVQMVNTVLSLPWWMWTAPLLLAAAVATWWCWPREDVFWNVELDSPTKS